LNPVEMAMPDEASVIKRLSEIPAYSEMFSKAFPEDPDPVNYNNLKKAIGAFERKLITPSKFDKYLAGDNSILSHQEKEGLQAFIATGCITCHAGNVLGGAMYQKFGLMGNYWEHTKSEQIDNGRFDITNNEYDRYMFKVPSLRNIEKTYPYFHDGSVKDLRNSIEIMAVIQLNKELTDKELDDITVFLKALTGEVPPDMKM
jgi:cytochrome c peroxidase